MWCTKGHNFVPAVGDVINPWNPNIREYVDLDILRLIIEGDEDLSARLDKIMGWLLE